MILTSILSGSLLFTALEHSVNLLINLLLQKIQSEKAKCFICCFSIHFDGDAFLVFAKHNVCFKTLISTGNILSHENWIDCSLLSAGLCFFFNWTDFSLSLWMNTWLNIYSAICTYWRLTPAAKEKKCRPFRSNTNEDQAKSHRAKTNSKSTKNHTRLYERFYFDALRKCRTASRDTYVYVHTTYLFLTTHTLKKFGNKCKPTFVTFECSFIFCPMCHTDNIWNTNRWRLGECSISVFSFGTRTFQDL